MMIYKHTFWTDDGKPVGTAFRNDDEFILITELDRKWTSIIKKDGKTFDDAIKYLQRHKCTSISSDGIYDVRHQLSRIESKLARTAAHRKGWLHAEEIEREDAELRKMLFEE
jgi:hypothetical protein